MADAFFTPRLFRFLADLKRHNDRDWFNANKQRYEEDLKAPALAFIADFAPYLDVFAPAFVADPRPSGGSLFRIYRDTRFAKDKSPYKTHVGIHFRHHKAKDVHAPGIYFHLEPKNCFLGAGIWHPEPKEAQRIREHIVEHPDAWKRATRAASFTKHFVLDGDSLKRPPRGIDPAHPLALDLKRKDFIAVAALPESVVTGKRLSVELANRGKTAVSLLSFLCDALGLATD